MKMNEFVLVNPGRWCYLTGGITKKSIGVVQEFTDRFVSLVDDWKFYSVDLFAKCPVEYEGFTSDTGMTQFTFIRDGVLRVLQTDGFLWGYRGEGPTGLIVTVNQVCRDFGVHSKASLVDEAIRRWALSRNIDHDHVLMAADIPQMA